MASVAPPAGVRDAVALQGRVSALINAYRVRGHLFAQIDPLGLLEPPPFELDLAKFGLAEIDPDTVFSTGDLAGPAELPLREIVARLTATYCRSIGVEYTHVEDPDERLWLQERMESTQNHAKRCRAPRALVDARRGRVLKRRRLLAASAALWGPKGRAQRNGAWPGARVPAARAAVDGTDDMPLSDSGTHSCESDNGSGTSAAPPHNIFSIVVCEGFPVVS
jgi:hypothetical protein